MRNFLYFNRGFQGDDLSANFTACGDRGAYWWFLELKTYRVKMRYGNGEQNTYNSTKFLQNTTNTLYTCTDATENLYHFFLWKKEQFPSLNDYGLGFLQNLVANGLRLNAINNELKEL